MLLIFVFIAILGQTYSNHDGDTITLRESHSSSATKCKADQDVISLVSEIKTPLGDTEVETVRFQMQKQCYPFVEFWYVNLMDCELLKTPCCVCTRKNINHFQVDINITASSYLSEAKLRGAIFYAEESKPIYSKELQLPPIYDINKITIFVIINNEEINGTKCEYITKSDDVNIVFFVKNITNVPYELNIFDQNSKRTNIRTSDLVTMSTSIYDRHIFILTLKVCNVTDKQKILTCTIQSDIHRNDEQDSFDTSTCLFAIFLAISIALIIIMFLTLKRRKNYWSNLQTRKNKQDNSIKTLEDTFSLNTSSETQPAKTIITLEEYIGYRSIESNEPVESKEAQVEFNVTTRQQYGKHQT